MAELDNFQQNKDKPWQRATHTYHECRCIFMALYVEMRQLTWFKRKKAEKDISQPGTLYAIIKESD